MQHILDGYTASATPDFVAAYDGLSPEAIYQPVIDLFPPTPSRIADIGAGTGRDAAWLAAKGHTLVAVEPVAALREPGRHLHPSPAIEWLDDRLPTLDHLGRTHQKTPFNLILLCAVWQHLDTPARARAIPAIAALLAPAGRLILSLRHGPGGIGRPVFATSPGETITQATDAGLTLLRCQTSPAIQPANIANGVHWTWLAFEVDQVI